ncbi:DUF3144 domain-containing protein [Thioalkalivibrio sp. ALE11]|uniref:DUF3144 domain-containing protein n=1 Tax=Thioalkalivibrio sp. ALE11 TaxID=1265494 RepID=UPI000687CEC7|nr:DUF3144 domain-containing protein [Thioalkalivibrio sp. ALE11]
MSAQDNAPSISELSTRFIELANQIKDEGVDVKRVSSALMQASAIYATYAAAGNQGYLQESGVKRVADVYLNGLREIQKVKKASAEQEGLKARESTAPTPVDGGGESGDR